MRRASCRIQLPERLHADPHYFFSVSRLCGYGLGGGGIAKRLILTSIRENPEHLGVRIYHRALRQVPEDLACWGLGFWKREFVPWEWLKWK